MDDCTHIPGVGRTRHTPDWTWERGGKGIREDSHVSGSFLRWEHRREGSGFDGAQTSARISYHFPAGASGKELAFQCRTCKRRRFNPWVRKIRWRRGWQPTPVFLPGESPWTVDPGGLRSIGSQRVRHD